MTARRETIVQEILTRLATVPDVALVIRQPNAQPTDNMVLTVDDRGQRRVGGDAIHDIMAMTVVIAGYVRGLGTTAAATVNELYAGTVRALMADGAQLGGLADLVTQNDMNIDTAATDQDFTSFFETVLEVQFRQRTTDPALI